MKIKNAMLWLSVLCFSGVRAQTIEPNLSWGKPSQQELTMTQYADDPDADAVELYRKTSVYYTYLNGDFRFVHQVSVRLKVLKPDGKRVADGQITLYDYDSGQLREKLVSLKATAFNVENGKTEKSKMERSMVNEERIDKYRRVTKFSVPQVKVGTVIEYEYTINSDYLFNIRDWNAQSDIPVLYTAYELTVPEWLKFNIEETGANVLEKKNKSGVMQLHHNGDIIDINSETYTFVGRRLPALKDDDFVWCAGDYGSRVTAELSSIYIPGAVNKQYTTTWRDIDKQLMDDPDFGGRLKSSSPFKAEIAASGIANIADKKEKVAAVWQLLRSRVRWNGEYSFWGKAASKVLKDGTGTNADINFLFINMLHDAGIDAFPIVMRTRNRGILPLTHASMKFLNTFVVGIEADDSDMVYFDSSAEDGFIDVLPSMLLVNRARLVKKDSPGNWVNLQEKARGCETTSVIASLREDGKLEGRRDRLLLYESASALRKRWRHAEDSTSLVAEMQDKAGIEIESYETEGLKDFSPSVKESIRFSKNCDVAGGTIYLNPFVIAQFSESPFTKEVRNLPVEFAFRQLDVCNVSVSLPDGYAVEDLPKPLALRLDGASVLVAFAVEDNTLKLQYKLNITKTFFTQEEYNDLKAFFDRLVESNKTIITIKKTA